MIGKVVAYNRKRFSSTSLRRQIMTATEAASVETSHAMGRRFFAEQDRLRGGPATGLCAPEYRAVLGGNPPMDRSAHEGFALAFYGAFPDMHHDIEEIIATEDRAVVRLVIHGTHNGGFFGIPATGRPVAIAANIILHLSGGKVTTLKAVFDEAGMLRQMGVLPSG
jgi:predicted ester cyclase